MAETKRIKLMVAIPTLDYIHYRFVQSLTDLSKRLDELGIENDIWFKPSTLVYMGRDWLAKRAREGEYTHVLWLDADMVFEPDIFEKLIADEKEMVCGLFRSRHDNRRAYALFSSLYPAVRYEALESNPELLNDIFTVEGCGFGCVLTTVDLLIRVLNANNNTCFMPTRAFGEDLAFCERVRNLGVDIYCDPAVEVGHIGHGIIKADNTVDWT